MKTRNINWFGKPTKSARTKVKPLFSITPVSVSPIKRMSLYPKRSKKEWSLIDRKPFGDRDRDRVPNIFDCKPLNRKKQGYLFRQEIMGRFGITKEDMKKGKKQLMLEIERINERERNAGRYGYKKIPTNFDKPDPEFNAMINPRVFPRYAKKIGVSPEEGKEILTGPLKIVPMREVVKFFEKNPDIFAKAKNVEIRKIRMTTPQEMVDEQHGFYNTYDKNTELLEYVNRVGGSFRNDTRDIMIMPLSFRKDKTAHTIKHEIQHGQQFKGMNIFEISRKYKEDPDRYEDDADEAGRALTARQIARQAGARPETMNYVFREQEMVSPQQVEAPEPRPMREEVQGWKLAELERARRKQAFEERRSEEVQPWKMREIRQGIKEDGLEEMQPWKLSESGKRPSGYYESQYVEIAGRHGRLPEQERAREMEDLVPSLAEEDI